MQREPLIDAHGTIQALGTASFAILLRAYFAHRDTRDTPPFGGLQQRRPTAVAQSRQPLQLDRRIAGQTRIIEIETQT